MKILLTIIGAAYLLASPTVRADSKEIELGSRRVDPPGEVTRWVVKRDQVLASPVWKPDEGPPPLSITKAIVIGKVWAKKQFPEMDDFYLYEVSFRRVAQDIPNRWFYSMVFGVVYKGRQLFGPGPTCKILMDGTVAEERRTYEKPDANNSVEPTRVPAGARGSP